MREVLDFVPGRFVVRRHVRPKLSCRECGVIAQALLEQAFVYVLQDQARFVERFAGAAEDDVSNSLIFDLALRAAVLKARLSRSPEDIDVAQARLDSHYVPVYRDAAEFAKINGTDRFCIHAGNANREKIHAACNGSINNFGLGLRQFWHYQAQLDLLKAPIPWAYDRLPNSNGQGADHRSGSSFVKRIPDDTKVKIRSVKDTIQSVRYARALAQSNSCRALDLGFLYAEFYARWSDLPKYWVQQPRHSESKARYLKLAMQELERLERCVPAAENPGRFRQIATRYLRYYDELMASPASALTPYDKLTVKSPNALYYRTVLGVLEQIRKGASEPNQERP